ncbi:MAG: NAD-binding protein [Lachnospiraceae bacterium]|nr:NAD-binding protein [Ruminococcus sp.]MCM1274870.1 NAD-binding protein [Lachnospiraceae bacterium]
MKAIIIGGGKVGFYLAQTLPEHGYSVAVIERDRERSRYCANNLDAEVCYGNGTTVEALESCGAEKADCVIAVTGQDESNLVCCQIAKYRFGVKRTIAKVNNPKNTGALKELGVDIVISATENIIQLLEREVDISAMKKLLPLDGEDASLMEITIPQNYALEGKAIMDLELPSGCLIACITRGTRTVIPSGKTLLLSGDVALVVMMNSAERDLRKALKIKD